MIPDEDDSNVLSRFIALHLYLSHTPFNRSYRRRQYGLLLCKNWLNHVLYQKMIWSYFVKNVSYWPHLVTTFLVCCSHSNVLETGMCQILFSAIFLGKLYITMLMFLLVLFKLRSFRHQMFSDSHFSSFFLPVFFFFLFPFQAPFSATMIPFGFPLIRSPHDSMSHGDETTKICPGEGFDETVHPVLSDTHGQAVRIQRLEMAGYTQEEVYIKRRQILDPQYISATVAKCTAVKSVRQQGFHYSHEMMSTWLQTVWNTPGCHCDLNLLGGGWLKGRQDWSFPGYDARAPSPHGYWDAQGGKWLFADRKEISCAPYHASRWRVYPTC